LSPWHVLHRYRVEWASSQFNIFWEGQCMVRRHLTIVNRKVIYCIRSDRSTRRRTIIVDYSLLLFFFFRRMDRRWKDLQPLHNAHCVFFFHTHTCIRCCTRVHYTEVFFTKRSRKNVQCSEAAEYLWKYSIYVLFLLT